MVVLMVAPMFVPTTARRIALLFPCALAAACSAQTEQQNGACTADVTLTASCNGTADGGAPQNLGLTGYTCTGTVRPDEQATYIEGVPAGIICASQTPLPDGGVPVGPQAYCCTTAPTTCAYDPVASCDPGLYAYECQNTNRPEAYNPRITCGQGTRGDEYVDYCCSGTGLPPGCMEYDGLTDGTTSCAAGLVGWQCPLQVPNPPIPKGQDLGDNKSRADQYYLLCSIGTPAPSGKTEYYCCYPPTQTPPGSSCVEDLNIPNCNPLTQFGFACTGPDTPADDFPPINCKSSGYAGTSMQGYPATLYCCDFE
jgi:hypothetical protein